MANSLPASVFLLGVMTRSGTNYLSNALCCHPLFSRLAIPEDYFLEGSDNLLEYVDSHVARWRTWNCPAEEWGEFLLQAFSDGIMKFSSSIVRDTGGIPVMKTPRLLGVRNAQRLFPNSKTLLLIRDGRDVVNSASATFLYRGRLFWMRQWRNGAMDMFDFMRANAESEMDKWMLVRYEELCAQPKTVIPTILNFLRADPERFDWDKFDHQPVVGSSRQHHVANSVDATERSDLKKFSTGAKDFEWSLAQKIAFRVICGRMQTKFGYMV